MENEPVWILITELLESGWEYSVELGRIGNKDTWILKNKEKEVVAYQIAEPEKAPFYNVYCLVEYESENGKESSSPEIIAFLLKGS
ncbi:hypothetical protein [Runella aurantiaca]|uniref:Uncharacterized protein n=1 Tax=Runella aurantiaca TaxID=2282308 RepID=A0A369IJ02_9BACT|nr:hypothetical protein [Runella aurantiaca]RDB07244.1 hypothetical protein DVG78_04315 [Runella aurantiaca]